MTKKNSKKPQKKAASKPAPKKKPAPPPKDARRAILESALKMAESRGWENISLRDIANGANVDLMSVFDEFQDKSDILIALGRMIDRRMLKNIPEPDSSLSHRDRLFDILMERFDALNEYRDGMISILSALHKEPKETLIGLPHLCRSMSLTLEAAGIEASGLRGAAKLAGLTGLYLYVLRVWKADDSPDMGKTMAALDKGLGRLEQAADTLGL